MSEKLIGELTKAKALFQQRAICAAMGINVADASLRKNEERELEQRTLVNLPELSSAVELPQCDICGDVHEGEAPRECETGDGI